MTTTGIGPRRSKTGKYTQSQPPSPGQRQAARDHLTRLRQDDGTYRSIAAAAALSPTTVHGLASGRTRAQPSTAAAILHADRPGPAPGLAGRRRDPAAAACPARDGPRLGPHRPSRRRPPRNLATPDESCRPITA